MSAHSSSPCCPSKLGGSQGGGCGLAMANKNHRASLSLSIKITKDKLYNSHPLEYTVQEKARLRIDLAFYEKQLDTISTD